MVDILEKHSIPLYKVHMPSETLEALREVLYSGQIANGPNVARFEALLQDYIGNPYITSTGDVSSSITLCLYMAGVRPGDEVLASPMGCLAANEPIKNLFAQVRWCDIDPLTGNIDPVDVERQVSLRTKAILIYHWAGNPVNLEAIYNIARKHGLRVVEDAQEALGAEYKGCKIGNTGTDFTVFSFYPNRQITTGEGGAISFRNADDYERARWLKRYGIHQPSFRDECGEINPLSEIPQVGYNSYMNHIAATIGITQMPYLPEIVARHQVNGKFYDEALCDISGIRLLRRPAGTESAYWVYTFLADHRDALLKELWGKGIHASKVHYRNDRYSCFCSVGTNLLNVDTFESRNISIPCGWWVTDNDRKYIVNLIKDITGVWI